MGERATKPRVAPIRRWAVLALPLLSGCANTLGIDVGDWSRLPDIEQLDYSRIIPAQPHQYWELRFSFGPGGTDRVIGSGGTRTRAELDAATLAALDAARPATGFAQGCLPGYCYKFIVAVNGSIAVYATRERLLEFLGTIDGIEEAALLAHARNLYWSADNRDTGYREVAGGWEIVGLELVKFCTPVQTDQVQLLVRRNGSVSELGRVVHSKADNACV